MGMPRSPIRVRRRAKTHNHLPVGPSPDVRRVAGELRVGISRGSVGWIRIHRMALTGFTGECGGIVRRGACPRSVPAGDSTVFAQAGGRCGVADVATGRAGEVAFARSSTERFRRKHSHVGDGGNGETDYPPAAG